METFVGIVFIAVCFLLIIVVLLQKGRGGGLGAAFGGAGSSAFGTRTGDVFTWITIVLTVVFLLLAIGATFLYRPPTGKVLTPKLSETGPIAGMTSVTITCDTRSARIAYTTDGSDPVEEKAKQAMVHAQVDVGQTLKVRAYRKKWDPSDLVEVTYKKKVAEPTTKSATTGPATTKPTSSPTTKPKDQKSNPTPTGSE